MTSKLFSENIHKFIPSDRDVFGKFIGEWSLSLTITNFDGSSLNYKGEWHFFRILQGRAIQDIWIIPSLNPKGSDEFHEYGTTIRTFNPKTGKWKAVWTGPVQNQFFVFDIEDNDDTITLMETGNPKLEMKWSFFDIKEDSFQWKSEMKIRGTNDWFTNYHMELIRIK